MIITNYVCINNNNDSYCVYNSHTVHIFEHYTGLVNISECSDKLLSGWTLISLLTQTLSDRSLVSHVINGCNQALPRADFRKSAS